MNKRQVWLERIEATEREYAVAQIATGMLETALRANPSLLTAADLERSDFQALRVNLEATFVVRMFAEFEAGARVVWRAARKKTTVPSMEQLLDAIASWRKVSHPDRVHAHRVREYRNSLVHDGDSIFQLVTLADARNYLRKFFRYMPPNW